MNWVLLNSMGMFIICVMNVINGKGGFEIVGIHIPAYYFFVGCSIGLTGWMIPKSFQMAGPENFFLIIMLGNVILTLGGALGAYFVFNSPPSVLNIVGAVVALVGIGLMSYT